MILMISNIANKHQTCNDAKLEFSVSIILKHYHVVAVLKDDNPI